MMDVVLLSRWQFALTSIYHWLFVPFTLGMTIIVAIMEINYVRTKNEEYQRMAKFWGMLFMINFAMGVVTGIVQEFHFGMNWAQYSRFMGDIFGAPLALEALTAFFMESTFMGAWIFGWDRLSPKVHAIAACLVAFGSNLSAFWILVANSFMQNPVGYVVRNGRAEMSSFLDLLHNPYVYAEFAHIFTAGLLTAGTVIAALSAWFLLRKRDVPFYTRSMKWGLVTMVVGGLLVMGAGHYAGQNAAKYQPMKLAAIEALWNTEESAQLSAFSVIDTKAQKNSFEISIPGGLSFMAHNSFNAPVQGLKELQATMVEKHGPGDYIPEVVSLFWTFRVMVAAGVLMFLTALIGIWYYRKGQLENHKGILKLIFWMLPLPYIANSCGWYVTEMGRQPWLVYGLQQTAAGVSKSITATDVWISMIGFTVVYIFAAIAALYLAVKHIKKGPEGNTAHDVVETKKEATLWN